MHNKAPPAAILPSTHGLHFDEFFLASSQGPLRRNDQDIALQKKPLALLWVLASQTGAVLSKDALLDTLWPNVEVTEGVIGACVKEVRRALGDDVRQPRFIATVHGIGYRFIAGVKAVAQADCGIAVAAPAPVVQVCHDDLLVGRARELAVLHKTFELAQQGQRQVLFVSGEAGIGKSSLIRHFLASLQRPDGRSVPWAHGQCMAHYGKGEPFLPLLEIATRLCQHNKAMFSELLKRHAPTWLSHLPCTWSDGAPHIESPSNTSLSRMLREMVNAVDAAAAEQPLVLVFEDMHWSDASTLDWLSMLAQRQERACLLVVVTCREAELEMNAHPLRLLKRELFTRMRAKAMPLGPLLASDVGAYLSQRMPSGVTRQALAQTVYRQSRGHPLFMVHVTNDLIARAVNGSDASPSQDTVPDTVTALIQMQWLRLAPEQRRVLEVASVVGAEFSSATVSAALHCSVQAVEQTLEGLTQHRLFIEERGLAEWRDGSVSGHYGFLHDLYPMALTQQLSATRRMRLHAAIGAHLAGAHGADNSEVAAELALHFEAARDRRQAAHFHALAGNKALQKLAAREAHLHASRGLDLLADLPDEQTSALTLKLLLIEGTAFLSLKGFGAAEVETTYTRAMGLALQLDASDDIAVIFSGLYNLQFTRAAFQQVAKTCTDLFDVLCKRPDAVLEMIAHNARGTWKLYGNELGNALEHVQHTLSVYNAQQHSALFLRFGEDPALAAHHYGALAHWVMGDSAQAQQHLAEGYALAQRLQHPFGEVQMLWMDALLKLDAGDLRTCVDLATRLIALCLEHEFPMWLAGGKVMQGCALVGLQQPDVGLALCQQGLGDWQASGAEVILPHFQALLARSLAQAGLGAQALKALQRALDQAHRTGEHWYLSELHRWHAKWLCKDEAAAALLRAVDVARAQGAKRFEARACLDLAGWHLDQRSPAKAQPWLQQARRLCVRMPASCEARQLAELWQVAKAQDAATDAPQWLS